MTARPPQIITLGGGGFSMEPDNPLLDDYILLLAGARRPRVLFIATASGDSDGYIARFHAAFPAERAEASHLPLFSRDDSDLRERILTQDVIYVGGGNTANLLAIWRIHGIDRLMREAWESGIILAGISAGMICWFECSVTDSFGPLAALRDGLGFLPGSACPHYDGEAQRRPTYHRLLAEGFPAGYAAEDGAALHFVGTELKQVVTSRPTAKAYRVERRGRETVESPLPCRFLGQ